MAFCNILLMLPDRVRRAQARVFEISLADLQGDEDQSYRKIRLRAEDVQGRNILTNFWGMDFTTDKLRSLVRKWQTTLSKDMVQLEH
ncbi:hypothetical protein Sjap_014148 [Stephania japonica]|uniref:Uncharacterized protein n=1 Tax=Stephania japonica TaxID=461633 RepID=A0AAP0J1U0_9MAGN